MRAFKITLIIVLALFILFIVMGMIGINQEIEYNPDALYIIIFISIGIILGLAAMLCHIKTFRYYRKSKSRKKVKKVSIFLWIAAVASSVYILLFSIFAFIGTFMEPNSVRNAEAFFTKLILIILFFYGVGSLVEISIVKKRIKKQHEEMSLQDEINEIGS